ncbi:sensor histidine kinase [Pedobacter nutrimenti]|nr:HAMP domain-containing sensor histidine kinase [Pedobacter nutrimenti]
MSTFMRSKSQRYWQYITGKPEEFSFESRIFHTISFVAIVALSLETLFNFFLTTLHSAGFISGTICVLQLGMFFLSRLKKRLTLAVILSAIEINIACALAYFFNSGITGSMLLLFVVSLFLVLLVIPRKQWLFWFFINLLVVILITGLEYYHPQLILQQYKNREELFTDQLFTYLMVITLIYICTVQLRKNYLLQKSLADEKAHKLEILNKEKDKLFSVISHDLTTPLASVKQYLDLLQQVELSAEEKATIEQQLALSMSDAQFLLQNLLQWARSQFQSGPLQLQVLNLKKQLAPTLQMFNQIASKKSISIYPAIQDKTAVATDPNILDLVVRNLLNNAVKFTRPGGEITLGTTVNDGQCILFIKDNGVGIAPEKQANIFGLKTESAYGTFNEKGTGLGLMLCKEYIELQGGKIWFESTASGTTFYVSMSIAD